MVMTRIALRLFSAVSGKTPTFQSLNHSSDS